MPRFTVPKLLAAAVIVASPGCRADDKNDDGADPGSTTTSTTGDTSTTAATSTTADTSEASATETGGSSECVEITAEAPCDAAAICAWDGVCHVHCPRIPDEASCMMQGFLCYWVDGACDYGGV